jgi:hypothetical protein
MADTPAQYPAYENVKIEELSVDSNSIVRVEVPAVSEGKYPRQHTRVIGGDKTPAVGRALIYSDTYSTAPQSPTFAYARHDVNQAEFLSLLETFITTAILMDFSELRGSTVRCVIQTATDLQDTEFPSYDAAVAALRAVPLMFSRIYFPFGDMTVEFVDKPSLVINELNLIHQGQLARAVDAPLFSFDASTSDTWQHFLLDIHWARRLFHPDVLRQVTAMAVQQIA